MTGHILLALGWGFYCALHSILAAGRVKRFTAKHFPTLASYYRIGYILFAFLGLVALIAFQLWLPTAFVWAQKKLVLVAGIVVMTSGLLLMAVCIKKIFCRAKRTESIG